MCYDKNSHSASRQVVFRLQFHMGLVHGHTLTFYKADLDCASEGIYNLLSPLPTKVLVAVMLCAALSILICNRCILQSPHSDVLTLDSLSVAGVGYTWEYGVCQVYFPAAWLCLFMFLSDARFPEDGKVELFFADSPERIRGRFTAIKDCLTETERQKNTATLIFYY